MNILKAIEQELAVVVRPLYFTAVHYQERTEWWFHETPNSTKSSKFHLLVRINNDGNLIVGPMTNGKIGELNRAAFELANPEFPENLYEFILQKLKERL